MGRNEALRHSSTHYVNGRGLERGVGVPQESACERRPGPRSGRYGQNDREPAVNQLSFRHGIGNSLPSPPPGVLQSTWYVPRIRT